MRKTRKQLVNESRIGSDEIIETERHIQTRHIIMKATKKLGRQKKRKQGKNREADPKFRTRRERGLYRFLLSLFVGKKRRKKERRRRSGKAKKKETLKKRIVFSSN